MLDCYKADIIIMSLNATCSCRDLSWAIIEFAIKCTVGDSITKQMIYWW